MNCLIRISSELFGFCSWVCLVHMYCSLTGLPPDSEVFTEYCSVCCSPSPFFHTAAISKPNPQLISKGKEGSSQGLLQRIIYFLVTPRDLWNLFPEQGLNPGYGSESNHQIPRELSQRIIYWCKNRKLAQSGKEVGGFILLFQIFFSCLNM